MKNIVLTFIATIFCATSFAQITGTTSVCVASTSSLSDATPGGTWSTSNNSIANVNPSSGVVSGVASGVANISYYNGHSYDVAAVTVNPLPASISGTSSVSIHNATKLASATPGGGWSIANYSVAVFTPVVAGMAVGVAAGSTTVSYTLPTGCSTTMALTVTP